MVVIHQYQNHTKTQRQLQANISDEYRCRTSQWNTCKWIQSSKGFPSWWLVLSQRCRNGLTYIIHHINRVKVGNHMIIYLMRCRERLWKKNPTFLHDKSPGETRDTVICLNAIVNLIKKFHLCVYCMLNIVFPLLLCAFFLSFLSSFCFCFSRVFLYKHPWFSIAICSWIATNEGQTDVCQIIHLRELLPVIPIFLKSHTIGYRLTF